MMIPGIDMFRLFITRLLLKKNPFKGDKNHLHHILLKKFNQSKVFQILFIFNFFIFSSVLFSINSILIFLIFIIIYTVIIKKLNFS